MQVKVQVSCSSSVQASFPVAMIKYSDKSNLEEEALFWLTVQR